LQARLLKNLKARLQKVGMKDITYLVINMNIAASQINRLKRLVDFPVYQDKDGSIWKNLRAYKDDFLVYDRCGRLTKYIPRRLSYLGRPNVRRAILKAYRNKNVCKGKCPEAAKKKA